MKSSLRKIYGWHHDLYGMFVSQMNTDILPSRPVFPTSSSLILGYGLFIARNEIENDTLNKAELNEIKIYENNEILEVPGINEPLIGLRNLCKNVMKLVPFNTKFNHE